MKIFRGLQKVACISITYPEKYVELRIAFDRFSYWFRNIKRQPHNNSKPNTDGFGDVEY